MWVRCPKCGHKLFSMQEHGEGAKIEIKCSSCKKIISVKVDGDGYFSQTIDGPQGGLRAEGGIDSGERRNGRLRLAYDGEIEE